MRQASQTSRQESDSTRHLSRKAAARVGPRTCDYLRKRHPDRTAENVAADVGCGVKDTTIRKMLNRCSAPRADLFVLLLNAYGLDFLMAVMTTPPAWMVEAYRAEEQARLRRQLAELQARVEAP